MAVSTVFVTTANTEMLNGTISGVTHCLGGETKITPKTKPCSEE